MAAICRAVAVKVMESRSRRKQEAGEGSSEGQDEVMPKEEVFKASEKDEEANLMHPPEMPIVIDEVALEDILGVSYVRINHSSVSPSLNVCVAMLQMRLCME